jgi:putative ABC transport system permease protein
LAPRTILAEDGARIFAMHELRTAVRSLAASRTFTVAAVLTLALGIGATAAVFGVVDAVLLRPLPYPEPDRIVAVDSRYPGAFAKFTLEGFEISPPELAASPALAAAGLHASGGLNVGEPAARVRATEVTPGFFAALGAAPAQGRVFTDADLRETKRLVVVGHRFWRARLAGDPAAVGRTLRLNGRPYTVLGVMPPRVDFPDASELWIPTGADPQVAADHTQPRLVARLAAGSSAAQAADEVVRRAGLRPDDRGPLVGVIPLRQALSGAVRPLLLLFGAAAALVLLVTIANVSSLLLARVDARTRELAVRRVLGASRARLARQLLAECMLLSAAAGAMALPAAGWALASLRALVPDTLHGASELAVDGRLLAAVAAVCLATTVGFGLAPALAIDGRSSAAALRVGAASTADPFWRRFRSALVVGQIGSAMVLLSLTVVVGRTFAELMDVDLGARGERTLTLELTVPRAADRDEWRPGADPIGAFTVRALADLRALPGVEEVGATDVLPASGPGFGPSGVPLEIEGGGGSGGRFASSVVATGGYFAALGIDRLAGRAFDAADAQGPPVAVVSERFAAAVGLTPAAIIGRRANVNGFAGRIPEFSGPQWAEIVGVVRDVRFHGPEHRPLPALYQPMQPQSVGGSVFIVLRAERDPRALVPLVREAIARIDPAIPVFNVRTFDDIRAEYLARHRLARLLMGAFGALTIVLAALGLYALVSYVVQLRTREIGVRIAIGAAPSRILRDVLARGVLHGVVGVAIGVPTTIAAWRTASFHLNGLGRLEPVGMASVAAAVLAIAAATAWLPARRATRVDPAVTLRAE